MQNDSYKEFDRQLRSMLQDAEEKVPSRVWSGIESRLEAPAPRRFAWGWAVAGLAAAAALATALVFKGTTGNSNQLYIPKEPVAFVESHEATDNPSTGLLAQAGPEVADVPVSRKVTVTRVREARPEIIDQPVIDEPSEPVIQDAPAPESVQKPASSQNAGEKMAVAELTQAQTDAEAWARILAEENVRKHNHEQGITFTANSSMGSNISGIDKMSARPAATRSARMAAEPAKTGIKESSSSTYGIPLSFGVGVNFPLLKGLSLGTGLEYTYMSRRFTGVYTQVDGGTVTSTKGDIHHGLHYIGVPLNLYYKFIDTERFNLYIFGGGTAEYCLSSRYDISSSVPDMVYREPVKGLQFSTQLGLGIQCKITNNLGIYFDPSAQYYFKSNQPNSIRTDKQFMVGAQLGLRFNL